MDNPNLIGNLSPISNKTAYKDKKKKQLRVDDKPVTEFQKHIRLVLDDELKTPWPTMFWKTVEKVGPDDILHPIQTYDEIGKSITVFLRHYQDYNGDHIYEVPLNRNLTEEEAEKIVFVWEQLYDEEMGDFIIETSTPYTGGQQRKSELFSRDQFEELAERIAKENHNNWMKRRVDNGWRYGLRFNKKDKTHPMIQPWEQLPEEYRNVDRNFPSFFTDLLGEYGFGVYVKESEEKLKTLRDDPRTSKNEKEAAERALERKRKDKGATGYNSSGKYTYNNERGKKVDIKEATSEFETLKKNKTPLTDEERKKVMDAGATWNHGPGGKPSPAVWKSKDSKGKTKFVCNTHRMYKVSNSLKAAINSYDEVERTA